MLKQRHVAAALDLADLAIRESRRETHLETLQLLSRYSLALGWSGGADRADIAEVRA